MSLAITLLLLALAAFVSFNWAAISSPSDLSLGFTQVTAPLGLVLLAFMAAVNAALLLYLGVQQASVILDLRRSAKAIAEQRRIADDVDASRVTELRSLIETEFLGARERESNLISDLSERIGRSERSIDEKLEQTTAGLAAQLGEIEDKLDRKLGL